MNAKSSLTPYLMMMALCLSTSLFAAQKLSAQPTIAPIVHGRVEVVAKADSSDAKAGAETGESATSNNVHPKKSIAAKGYERIPKTVVWLTPSPGSDIQLAPPDPRGSTAKLVQKNKSFEPRLLVIPAGTMVEFPNHDPFFHNVFSLFEGKRFDLGLYEAGTSRSVRFDRPGISYIFCNIHPEMNAVVITMGTPLYATASDAGEVSIANVPYGRYTLHTWSEGLGPDDPPETKEITIGDRALSLGAIPIHPASGPRILHKNKYGRDYDDPTPGTAIYPQR
jgi:plastocyanin